MEIIDKNLGIVKLKKSAKATRIVIRYRDGYFMLTYPPSVSLSYIRDFLRENESRLLSLKEKNINKILFTPDMNFETFSFKLNMIENETIEDFYMKFENNFLLIYYPLAIKFDNNDVQSRVKSLIEKALRFKANQILPYKVKVLAEKYRFEYSVVKINTSRGRWGSCSSKKNINLSFYIMLLPEYLADFVILHELCHTIEMNHGENFWMLLDEATNGKAKELTKELNAFRMPW